MLILIAINAASIWCLRDAALCGALGGGGGDIKCGDCDCCSKFDIFKILGPWLCAPCLTYDDLVDAWGQSAAPGEEGPEPTQRREEEAKANAPKIKFTVREMTGKEDPVETLGALHTIAELRQAVAQLTGKGADTFNLTLQGHLLKDGEGTLGSHGIEEGVVVVMTPGSQPGPQPDVDEGVPEPPDEGVPPAQP